MATASAVPGPVGYLVNHPGGLAGVQGIGYDYVLGSGGVYVQSQGAHLTARVLVAPGEVRGLAPVAEKVELTHGPIPVQPLRAGAALVPGRPGHRAVLRRALGRAKATGWWSPHRSALLRPSPTCHPQGVVAEFHSHGGSRAFFSATDDRDEQGFRIYGVVGRLDAPRPELRLRVGVYGHFAPLDWPQVFGGPHPGLRLMGEEPEPTREQQSERQGGN